jgi:hypothetical protein
MHHLDRELFGLRQGEEAARLGLHLRHQRLRHAMPAEIEEADIPRRRTQLVQEVLARRLAGIEPGQVEQRQSEGGSGHGSLGQKGTARDRATR